MHLRYSCKHSPRNKAKALCIAAENYMHVN